MKQIKFNAKPTKSNEETVYGLEIYRSYSHPDESDNRWSYIDTMHPMSMKDLQELRDYLSELIWREFNQ